MIVWIASYPRSGNTLLRTVINQTMHIQSYSDEFAERINQGLSDKSLEITGNVYCEGDWSTFYKEATESKDVFLVKTHQLPRDSQPAIYVVRDGRKVLISYSRYHKSYTQPPYPSLLDLILGLDYYGSWTQHFHAWECREKTLIVKYEDLIQPSEKLLTQLSALITHVGRITPWKNPFKELQRENPDFFREGIPAWSNNREWTPALDAIFFHLHGKLMSKLGYMTEANIAGTQKLLTQEMIDLIDVTIRLLSENKRYRTICDERLNVIAELKQACDDRLNVISDLKQTCDHRLSLIEDLNKRLIGIC